VVRLLLDAAPSSDWYRKEAGFNPAYCLRLAVAHESVDVVALLLDPPPSVHAILLQTATPDPNSVLLSDEGSSLSASEASFQVRRNTITTSCSFINEACLRALLLWGRTARTESTPD
jgi:hypothetical protein